MRIERFISDQTEAADLLQYLDCWQSSTSDKLRNANKAMSALNESTGGALVKPPKFMGKRKLKRTDWKAVAQSKSLDGGSL